MYTFEKCYKKYGYPNGSRGRSRGQIQAHNVGFDQGFIPSSSQGFGQSSDQHNFIIHPDQTQFEDASHDPILPASTTMTKNQYEHILDMLRNVQVTDTQPIAMTANVLHTDAQHSGTQQPANGSGCTRSVSIVPAAYYAHLAAFRARYYVEGRTSDGDSMEVLIFISSLLSGTTLTSPVAKPAFFGIESNGTDNDLKAEGSGDGNGNDKGLEGYKQNRPMGLMVPNSSLFFIPPGLSSAGFLNSPGFLSPLQSPFGMSHQQALAHVTAQAVFSQSLTQMQADYYQCSSSAASSVEVVAETQPSSIPITTLQQKCCLFFS